MDWARLGSCLCRTRYGAGAPPPVPRTVATERRWQAGADPVKVGEALAGTAADGLHALPEGWRDKVAIREEMPACTWWVFGRPKDADGWEEEAEGKDKAAADDDEIDDVETARRAAAAATVTYDPKSGTAAARLSQRLLNSAAIEEDSPDTLY